MSVEKTTISRSGSSHRVEVVALTQAMIRRVSDKKTVDVVTYAEDLARKHGLETRRIPTNNLDGTIDEGNPNLVIGKGLHTLPTVLLASHIDTVGPWKIDPIAEKGRFEPFGAIKMDGRIIGRGASDSKGGAAAQLAALINRRRDLPSKCAVLFTAREETDLRGLRSTVEDFRNLESRNPGAGIELICASGSNAEYATGSRGVLEAKVVFEGRTGHTARSFEYEDAPSVRDAIIASLRDRVLEIPQHQILGGASLRRTADLSGFHDGKGVRVTTNQIPNYAEAVLGVRLNSMPINGEPFTPAVLERIIEAEIIKKFENGKVGLKKFETLAFVEAAVSDPEKVRWIVEKAQRITGREIKQWVYGERGLEEMIEMVNALRKKPELIVVGPGKQGQYHMPDEYVEIQSLKDYEEVYGEVVTDGRFRTLHKGRSLKDLRKGN